MRSATRNDLDGDAWKLYDYIARHFIGTLARDCRYLSTVVTIAVNNEVFHINGKTLIDPGYTEVMTWQVSGLFHLSDNGLQVAVSLLFRHLGKMKSYRMLRQTKWYQFTMLG